MIVKSNGSRTTTHRSRKGRNREISLRWIKISTVERSLNRHANLFVIIN